MFIVCVNFGYLLSAFRAHVCIRTQSPTKVRVNSQITKYSDKFITLFAFNFSSFHPSNRIEEMILAKRLVSLPESC